MKRLLLLFIFYLVIKSMQAQTDSLKFQYFDKGKNMAGLIGYVGWGANKVVGQISLRYGRFWMKKFNAGLETSFASHGSYYKSYYFQPFARYYILNKKLSPFIETNYSYGLSTQTNV